MESTASAENSHRAIPESASIGSSPKQAAFGTVFTPNMLCSTYANGAWSEFVIRPLQKYTLHPASLVLHYSQSIFEGMKAYRHANDTVTLFRPEVNARRLNQSAERMAIPPIDEAKFLEALAQYVHREREHIPDRPGSLYLRPAIFASEAAIGVRTAVEFEFFVIAMPVESYFANSADGSNSIDLFVSETVARAAPGGTGAVKAGANYAVTLKVINEAKKLGCWQVLFLSPGGQRFVEEAGGMNLFAVHGTQLITPPLSGTILSGVTRDSILQLASSLSWETSEEAISIDTLVSGMESGEVSEAFLCGTAATVMSIGGIQFQDGRRVKVGKDARTPVADLLSDKLLDIQFGVSEDSYNWLRSVP